METEWNEETSPAGDADREKSDAVANLEIAIDNALRAGISDREIRKIIKEILEYSL